MPGKLKAKIVAGRHLPVMDRASDLTDAFVEVSNLKKHQVNVTLQPFQHVQYILCSCAVVLTLRFSSLMFLQVKFGNTTFKTDVYPKSLNPQWNSEWFKFEVKCLDMSS